ncbi:MAG: diguanylate cyclase [Acidobacteriota bacterium]
MIPEEMSVRLRDELLAVLNEDARNQETLLGRLEQLRSERGLEAHSTLLLILTRLQMEEAEARKHWQGILALRKDLTARVGRDVGLRVAVLDYFLNINRRLTNPKVIELAFSDSLERFATTDPLTGLSSRSHFRSALQKELRRARRYRLPLSLLRLDLDSFRTVNESRGHLVGDRILREIAILIQNKIRDIDTAARLGEDEFAVLLPETERMGAYLVGERIRITVTDHFRRKENRGDSIPLTLSGGIAEYPADSTLPEKLMTRAGEALYQAKGGGKNRTATFFRERRNFIRFDVRQAGLALQPIRSPKGSTRTSPKPKNLSRSGLLFESNTAYDIGEELQITCQGLKGIGEITFSGRVVRIEELEGSEPTRRFDIGVVFQLDWEHQEQALDEWLRQQ